MRKVDDPPGDRRGVPRDSSDPISRPAKLWRMVYDPRGIAASAWSGAPHTWTKPSGARAVITLSEGKVLHSRARRAKLTDRLRGRTFLVRGGREPPAGADRGR